MSARYSELVAAWHSQTARLAGEILVQPAAYALATIAQEIIAEGTTEMARLKGELDRYQGRQVLYATDARLEQVSEQVDGAQPGTVLRATDTGRELQLGRDGGWSPRGG